MNALIPGLGRALRHPSGLLLVWAFRLLAAWILSAPIARALGSTVRHFPEGDARLFEPGAGFLAEAVRLELPTLAAEARGAAALGCVLAWLALVPLAALMEQLAANERLTVGSAIGRGVARLPGFTFLAGLTWLVQAGLAVVLGVGLDALGKRLNQSLDERQSDLCLLAGLALGLACVALLGVVHDLARAALLSRDRRVLRAVATAFGTLRARPFAALHGWAVPALGSVGLVGLAALITGALDVSRGGAARWLAVGLVHQTAVIGLVLLRAAWLARALDLVRDGANAPQRASDGTFEDSDGPADPTPDRAA